jgi:F-type H+-transporting ATPase subunit b
MLEIFGKLGIDLWIVVGQIINFLLLAWILSKLLYKPVFQVLEKRKKIIEDGLENARLSEEKLQEVEQKTKEILQDATKQAKDIINEAHQISIKQTEEQEKKLITKLKRIKEQAKDDITSERNTMLEEMKKSILEVSIAINEKILSTSLPKQVYKNKLEEVYAKFK